jgi:hypothetical protein
VKNLRQILSSALEQVIRVGNDADTRDVVFERDIPEPSTTAGLRSKHKRCTAVEIRFAMCAFEIRIKHGFLKFRIAHAPAELVREHRQLSGRIDNDVCVELFARAVLHLHFNTNRTISLKQHLLHQHALMYSRTLLSSMINQEVIEFRARHLPGDSTLVMHRFEEVERS